MGKLPETNHPARVVLDTITTRFLMLFIIVLVIPLFSLIIFTNSILKNDIDTTIRTVLSSRDASFQAKLLEEQHAYGRILHHFAQQNTQNIQNLCSPSVKETCFLIDFSRQQVSFPDKSVRSTLDFFSNHPTLKQLSQFKMREGVFYIQWNNRLFMFNAYRADANPGQWYLLGTAIDNGLLREYYKENPDFKTGLWLLKEPFDSDNPQWFARGVDKTSGPLDLAKTEILQQLEKQNTTLDQSLINTSKQAFQVHQRFLYDLNNKKIARIVILLPLAIKDEIIATYSLGIYIIVIASLLFSITVAIIASRSITRPMLKLIQQVTSLGKTGQLSERVTVKGVHEINALGKAFNNMLDKLEQEHQTKDDFVATLTHDLKVPLLSEKQTLEYLAKGTYGSLQETQGEVLQVLQASNQSNLDLVNGILEIYRYESGQIKLNPEAIEIDTLIKTTVEELRPLAHEKNIQLTIQNDTQAQKNTQVWADRIEIKRVLTNLISNALTNTPKHGKISCRLTDSSTWGSEYLYKASDFNYTSLKRPLFLKDRIAITVQDSGIGFSVDDLPRLFKQFAANRGRNPMSIGLGLYNCYQVLQEHHGAIWVETTEGEGSAVTILVPSHEKVFQDRRKSGDRRKN